MSNWNSVSLHFDASMFVWLQLYVDFSFGQLKNVHSIYGQAVL